MITVYVNPVHLQRFREELKAVGNIIVVADPFWPAWKKPVWWRRWFLRAKSTIPVLAWDPNEVTR